MAYSIELPTNSCVYEYRWIADYNVSERARLPSERMTELKHVSLIEMQTNKEQSGFFTSVVLSTYFPGW